MAHETTPDTARAWYDQAFEVLMQEGNFAILAIFGLVALAIVAFLIYGLANSSRSLRYRHKQDGEKRTTEFSSDSKRADGTDNAEAVKTPAE